MRKEALENLFARYVSEGKWAEEDVPKGIRENVRGKVRNIRAKEVSSQNNDNTSNKGNNGNNGNNSNNSNNKNKKEEK